jgi:hypothetical protein
MTGKLVRLPSGKWVSEADAARTAAFERGEPVDHDDELWSILDWSFWGAGMADTFRVPLADTMIKAISAEQHKKALDLIARWTELRGEHVFQARYEELQGENDHLRAQLAEATARREEKMDELKKRVGLQDRTLTAHCIRRDEQQAEIDRLQRELNELRGQEGST